MVCPTTLIYNWENEIRKFTPVLTYRIHHGATRTRVKEEILDHDITITTYGTLRSDIKLLMSVNFDYVILDESQAIKNPVQQGYQSCLPVDGKASSMHEWYTVTE